VTSTSDVWLEANADRSLARQRAKVDTAKLVVTFAAGVSATMVATGLQVGPITLFDRLGASMLGACILATILTAVMDRLAEPDTSKVLELSVVHGWTDSRLTNELRAQLMGVVKNNSGVVSYVMCSAVLAIATALAAGMLPTLSLLGVGY